MTVRFLMTAVILAAAATAQPARTGVATSFTQDGANLPLEKIGRDDLIGISVYDAPELTRTVRVAADGAISLPMLDEPIVAAGLYPNQLEKLIASTLIARNVMVRPIVTVSVVEYRSRPINVAGAVRSPITFQATGVITLLEAISRAGGLSDNAGPEIFVSQPHIDADGRTAELIRRIPVRELVRGSDPAMNLNLEGGEQIRVPEAERFFVVGNVKQPGAFPMHDGAESTLLKALALSQGLLPYASKTAYIYRQESGAGAKNEIPVELKKIIDRKAPDVPLLANDIVYIPDNTGKRTALTTIEKTLIIASGLGGAAIYAVSR